MQTIDEVDLELLPILQQNRPIVPYITQKNLPQVRQNSNSQLANRPAYGPTKAQTVAIDTPAGLLDLYIFHGKKTTQKQPCLVWMHGGGYIMGHGNDTWFGPLFAEQTGCTVVSVDYRLAPEHPFPAAIEDGHAALHWVTNNAAALGIDSQRIALGGASAGAGLAAGLCLYNRDHQGPDIMFQLLLYPMLDNQHATPSGTIEDHPVWPRQTSMNAWDMYLKGQESEYASATRATNLTNLAPAFISVGAVDLFRDECINYAKCLATAGVDAVSKVYAGMYHSGEVGDLSPRVSQQMSDDYVAALQRAFGKNNS